MIFRESSQWIAGENDETYTNVHRKEDQVSFFELGCGLTTASNPQTREKE